MSIVFLFGCHLRFTSYILLRILDRLPFESQRELGIAKFECGWMGFVRDNNLKARDVCVFVFINNNIKPLIDVVYFCTTESEDCTTDGEQTKPEMKETDEDDDSNSS
ncbi:hypothetical protein DVH24_002396 [Malus domestica]|uniref:TF-B3 domain-containing protein n=1 Tax=Malus domestica TaxID=3750 RepID=A0A498IKF9_MALDO|nr:hypothetical protein DVH24_002396 [Malus domestica]